MLTPGELYWSDAVKAQYVNIEGCLIRYIKTGNGQPMLLLHTIRTQLDYFQKVIPALAARFEVYALDIPGHGLSCLTSEPEYNEPALRKLVGGFMETMKLTNIIVVGESIGAALALALAGADEQQKIKKVFALNAYDYGPPPGIKRSTPLAGILFTLIHWPLLGWVVSHAPSRSLLKHVFSGGFYDKKNMPSLLLDEFQRVGKLKGYPEAFTSILRNWKSWVSAKGSYKAIKVPVVLIYGDSDWSSEKEREETGASIPVCQTIILKNTGHFSCLDNPGEILRIVMSDK